MTPAARALRALCEEYLLITLPVVIYVFIEAASHGSLSALFLSPEWSIATMFLVLQTSRLCREKLEKGAEQVVGTFMRWALMIIIIAASINAYIGATGSLEQQSMTVLGLRWLLFGIASVLFVYVGGASLWAHESSR